MYLIRLDNSNIVISVVTDMESPFMVPLDASYMLSLTAPAIGHIFDPVDRTFSTPPRNRWVTKLAFWNRMTQAERIGIDLASERPVQGVNELAVDFETRRSNAAALRDMRAQLDAASYIDLTRADTQQGVYTLEAMGLLAPGRAVEILDGPIAEHEYYRTA